MDKIKLIARPVPTLSVQVEMSPPAGLTVLEYIDRAGIDNYWDVGACINGRVIEVDEYGNVHVLANQELVLATVPQGGDGKEIFSMVALIAIAVAAPYAAAALAPSLGITSAIGISLLTAGIGLAGSLLLRAIAPTPSVSLGDLSGTNSLVSPSYSITGIRNAAQPYGVVPKIYGQMRVFPPLVSAPYTRIVGGEQQLRMLFGWYGECTISDIKIGATPIEDYAGVAYEIVDTAGASVPNSSLYNTVSLEESFTLELNPEKPTEIPSSYGPGDWFQKTTAADTETILLDRYMVEGC